MMTELEKEHLWEVDHPYYCNESNYFADGPKARECMNHHKSWQEFVEGGMFDSDEDLNLLFRWDWQAAENPSNDDYYRDGTLKLFFFIQRKGFLIYTEIDVCRADEPSIREWLAKRYEKITDLWAPIAESHQKRGDL